MAENVVEEYGWANAQAKGSAGYLVAPVIRILRHHSAHHVLDLGAGNGHLCGELAAQGFHPVGVEYDERGVRIAREAYPSLSFYNLGVQDDPREIEQAEGKFDAVVSTEVIEHLFSPHLLPIFAKRLLKPGGLLVISTPYHGYLKNLALSAAGKWDQHMDPLWHGGHIKLWSRKTLTRLLTEAGFEVIAFEGAGRLPFLWKSMILVARVRPGGG